MSSVPPSFGGNLIGMTGITRGYWLSVALWNSRAVCGVLPNSTVLMQGKRGCRYAFVERARDLAAGFAALDVCPGAAHWVGAMMARRRAKPCSYPAVMPPDSGLSWDSFRQFRDAFWADRLAKEPFTGLRMRVHA